MRETAPVMLAVDRETKARFKILAGDMPMMDYLRQLSIGDKPPEPVSDRLDRIEQKLDIISSMDLPDEQKEDIRQALTLTPELKALIPAILEKFGVSSMLEVLDVIKYHREHGNSQDKIESMRVYAEFAEIFGCPGLPWPFVDMVLRRTFEIVGEINNPDKPKGEG